MDGMALLCNLHADGPETLRSLREEGCTTLADLHELGVERLSALIGFTPAAARRFLREGRLLLERLDDRRLEGEEPLGAPAPTLAADPAPRPSDLPRNEQAILARVLARWHEVDPMGATKPEPAPASVQAPITALEPDDDGGDHLSPGLLEGLDAAHCRALALHGIETLKQLAERSAEEISRATGLPFTRARTLQFLARRGATSDVLPALEPAPRRQVASGEKISLAFPDLPLAPISAASAPAGAQRASSTAAAERETPAGPFA